MVYGMSGNEVVLAFQALSRIVATCGLDSMNMLENVVGNLCLAYQ